MQSHELEAKLDRIMAGIPARCAELDRKFSLPGSEPTDPYDPETAASLLCDGIDAIVYEELEIGGREMVRFVKRARKLAAKKWPALAGELVFN